MSIIDDCVQFLEDLILGDFNDQQMVSAQIIGGLVSLIPVMDQVMDARDVSGCLYRINKRGGFGKATLEEKVDFGFAAFGVVPELGSAVKTVFKPLYRQRQRAKGMINGGVAMIERMLGHKKGGAVRWVRALDWAGNTQLAIVQANAALESCIAMLDYLGQSHWWVPDRLERLARDVAPSLKAMRGKLAAPIREAAVEIRKFLEEMLGEHAAAVAMSVASGTVSRPRSQATGNRTAGAASRTAHKPVASAPRTQARTAQGAVANTVQATAFQLYAPLNFALKGLLGEHIVEHHVIERKGWGLQWNRHDMAGGAAGKAAGWQSEHKKINDNQIPTYLCTPSGNVLKSGIDSAWLTNRPRPHQFAVVEAKASMNPRAKLTDLLGEANEEATGPRQKPSRRNRTGGVAVTGGRTAQSPKKVMQMSHGWIVKLVNRDLRRWRLRILGNYSRHVFLVTPLQAAEHIRAAQQIAEAGLQSNPAGAQRFAHMHSQHDTQREFLDADLVAAEEHYNQFGKAKRRTTRRK